MCIPNLEFQLVNPTTQVALFSICQDKCSSLLSIRWNIYQGFNTTLSTMQWILFNETYLYENICFFGKDFCVESISSIRNVFRNPNK